jgi:hypothetical protein
MNHSPEFVEAVKNLQESINQAHRINAGLGWNKLSELMSDLGLSRECGIKSKKRRVRVKKMKQIISHAFLQKILDDREKVRELFPKDWTPDAGAGE